MGLLLHPDAYYAETTDGVYFLSPEGESTLTGRSVYRVVDRLAPFLDGRHTLAELTAHLPAERATLVGNVMTALVDRALVHEVVHEVAPDEDAGTVPAGSDHRTPLTVVIGAGRLCRAVVVAAQRVGLGRVRLVPTSECPTDLDGLGTVETGHWPDRPDAATATAIRSLVRGADRVVHASDRAVADRTVADRALLLERVCGEAGAALAQVLTIDGHVWITGGVDGASWSSCWRRLVARRSPRTGHSVAGYRPDLPVDDLAATAVAAHLVNSVVRSGAAATRGVGAHATRVNVSTLESESVGVVPHPLAGPPTHPGGPSLRGRIRRLRRGAALSEDAFSRRAASCVGDVAGVFGVPSERDLVQLPLHVCEIEVSDPVGLLDPRLPGPTATGVGPDLATARYRAALTAFATYASLMVDPRRVIVLNGRPADPDTTLTGLTRGWLTGLVAGHGLADDVTHLVPATRVFPALRPQRSPYRPPTGVAAAYDWDGAVTDGLLAHCRRLTLAGLTGSPGPYPLIDPAGAALDARGDRYRSLLAAIGIAVEVYDVTGPLGVPTVLCHLGSEPAGCASGLSSADALTGAIEQALVRYQTRNDSRRANALPPLPHLPTDLRGTAPRALPDAALPDWTACVAALTSAGHRPVAVPLDHDPAVHAVIPSLVHVVLDDE